MLIAAFRGGAEAHMYQVLGTANQYYQYYQYYSCYSFEPQRFVDSIASPIKAISTKVVNEGAHASF